MKHEAFRFLLPSSRKLSAQHPISSVALLAAALTLAPLSGCKSRSFGNSEVRGSKGDSASAEKTWLVRCTEKSDTEENGQSETVFQADLEDGRIVWKTSDTNADVREGSDVFRYVNTDISAPATSKLGTYAFISDSTSLEMRWFDSVRTGGVEAYIVVTNIASGRSGSDNTKNKSQQAFAKCSESHDKAFNLPAIEALAKTHPAPSEDERMVGELRPAFLAYCSTKREGLTVSYYRSPGDKSKGELRVEHKRGDELPSSDAGELASVKTDFKGDRQSLILKSDAFEVEMRWDKGKKKSTEMRVRGSSKIDDWYSDWRSCSEKNKDAVSEALIERLQAETK